MGIFSWSSKSRPVRESPLWIALSTRANKSQSGSILAIGKFQPILGLWSLIFDKLVWPVTNPIPIYSHYLIFICMTLIIFFMGCGEMMTTNSCLCSWENEWRKWRESRFFSPFAFVSSTPFGAISYWPPPFSKHSDGWNAFNLYSSTKINSHIL
jgi:hypothetical protein